MGLFDTFIDKGVEIQMKCFYTPFSSLGKIMHSGGSCEEYRVGDVLPLETSVYKFEDTCIFLTDAEELGYIYVEERIFQGFLSSIEEIPSRVQFFYSSHGKMLNLKNVSELVQFETAMNDPELTYHSREYQSWFVQPSFEDRLDEHMYVLLKSKEMELFFFNNPKLKLNSEHETHMLKKELTTFETEDPVRYETYLKRHHLRLKILFL